MDRLKFYNIDDQYIEYLYQFDKKVPFNKNSKRPYIGIILEINGITYFAPMFSPKFPVHSQVIDNVVDKTGAGDCLNGVFLNLLVNGESEESALRTAVDMATESIKQHGILGLRLPNQNQERVV